MSADYRSCGCTPYLLCVDHATDWGKVRDPDSRHWISRSDYNELERRCDGLERELETARRLGAIEALEKLYNSLPQGESRSAASVLADAIVAAREGRDR